MAYTSTAHSMATDHGGQDRRERGPSAFSWVIRIRPPSTANVAAADPTPQDTHCRGGRARAAGDVGAWPLHPIAEVGRSDSCARLRPARSVAFASAQTVYAVSGRCSHDPIVARAPIAYERRSTPGHAPRPQRAWCVHRGDGTLSSRRPGGDLGWGGPRGAAAQRVSVQAMARVAAVPIE
jgi:hypothetical protein